MQQYEMIKLFDSFLSKEAKWKYKTIFENLQGCIGCCTAGCGSTANQTQP